MKKGYAPRTLGILYFHCRKTWPDTKDLSILVNPPSTGHTGDSNSWPPDLELGAVTKWLASRMLVWVFGRLLYIIDFFALEYFHQFVPCFRNIFINLFLALGKFASICPCFRNIFIDWETLRGRLRAAQVQGRALLFEWFLAHIQFSTSSSSILYMFMYLWSNVLV